MAVVGRLHYLWLCILKQLISICCRLNLRKSSVPMAPFRRRTLRRSLAGKSLMPSQKLPLQKSDIVWKIPVAISGPTDLLMKVFGNRIVVKPHLSRGMDATFHVNAAEPIGRIDPHVYGQLFANAGNCVYDGLWVGEDSAIPNWRGIRIDTNGPRERYYGVAWRRMTDNS